MNGEHTNTPTHGTEDLVNALRDAANGCGGFDSEARLMMDAAAEIERLREVITIPLITPESSSTLFLRVLTEHEKGQPVNAQDLINALMWRVNNQRRELARKNQDIQELTCGDPRKVCPNCRENAT